GRAPVGPAGGPEQGPIGRREVLFVRPTCPRGGTRSAGLRRPARPPRVRLSLPPWKRRRLRPHSDRGWGRPAGWGGPWPGPAWPGSTTWGAGWRGPAPSLGCTARRPWRGG